MNVKELIAALSRLSPTAFVIMASDAEGNEMNILDNVEAEKDAVILWPRHGRR